MHSLTLFLSKKSSGAKASSPKKLSKASPPTTAKAATGPISGKSPGLKRTPESSCSEGGSLCVLDHVVVDLFSALFFQRHHFLTQLGIPRHPIIGL